MSPQLLVEAWIAIVHRRHPQYIIRILDLARWNAPDRKPNISAFEYFHRLPLGPFKTDYEAFDAAANRGILSRCIVSPLAGHEKIPMVSDETLDLIKWEKRG